MRLEIRQIVYSAKQDVKKLDYPNIFNYPPNNPEKSYLFMESRVLNKAINSGIHKGLDYFGILSPDYVAKLEECKNWGKELRNNSTAKYKKELFHAFVQKYKGADIISLTHHKPHSTFLVADKYHPNISKITQSLLNQINFNYDVRLINKTPIYFNYFVASPEILEAFNTELLNPFMKLANLPILMNDSKYSKPFPPNLAELYGINYWPYHPFIAERLITIFASKHNLNVKSF
jgi:hypothetical protein